MATDRLIHDLSLVPVDGHPTVIYRRRTGGSTLDERVRASVIAYRTFVGDGEIYTDVLVEDTAGMQEFVALQKVTFMKKAADIPPPASLRGTLPSSGF